MRNTINRVRQKRCQRIHSAVMDISHFGMNGIGGEIHEFQFVGASCNVRASIDPWPKFRSAHLFPWSATCWGVPSPNPADRRSAPVLWRSRATKIRQPRPLRSRLTGRKSEAVSAIAAERRTRRNSTPALRLYCSIGPIRQK